MSKPIPLTLAELTAIVFPNGVPPPDPRPILVRWEDMPLTYCGEDGLDWERVKNLYTSKQEDDDEREHADEA